MGMKYGLAISELMDFFCEGEHQGFSEQDIQDAEQNIGAPLPASYRSFLKSYGGDAINTHCHTIAKPENITTSYDCIEECITEEGGWQEEFEEAVKNGEESDYEDNEYFKLWQLPKEQWHTITENYVLIWHENQGVWCAGYLLKDLQADVTDPPVYISINDDFISFEKYTPNTYLFLLEMLRQNAWGYHDGKRIWKKDEIRATLSSNNIVLEQLKHQYEIPEQKPLFYGTCLDDETGTLYIYYAFNDEEELLISPKI